MIASNITARCIGTVIATLAMTATLTLTAPTSGQFGSRRGFQREPEYTTRDIQLAVDSLKLDETQKLIVQTLFEDYRDAYRDSKAGFFQTIENMRDQLVELNDQQELLRIVFGALGEWQANNERLSEQFIQDVQRLLSEDQQELWPPFEHKMYRLKHLKNGKLSGERLDLFVVMKELDLAEPEMQEVDPVLRAYEVELDAALHRREEQIKSSQGQALELFQNDGKNAGVILAGREIQLHKSVRDVNERYVQSVAAALPQEHRPSFLEKVHMRSFTRVYRTTLAQRTIRAAKELDDLAEDILIAIEELEMRYLIELGVFNERIVGLIKEKEPQQILHKAKAQQAKITGQSIERPEDHVKTEFAKRRAMGQRFIDQLKAILSPEQIALLPGMGTFRPDGLIADPTGKRQTMEDMKRAREDKIRRLQGGGLSIRSTGGGKQKKGDVDN